MVNKNWDDIQAMLVSGGYDPSYGSSPKKPIEESSVHNYCCPRGHTFNTANPLIIAVENDTEYNTGPICVYCLVDWHKRNVNAEQITDE